MSVDLYEPISVLKPVAENLWIIDGPVVRMSIGPAKVPFSTRAVVIRLQSGELWVHSPTGELPDALVRALGELGPMGHLVSPNAFHYTGIPRWQERFPSAVRWSSPGVEARAQKSGIAVAFDQALTDEAPPSWSGEIDQLIFRGSRMLEEVVFFHRASRTLLMTDLIANFELDKIHGWALRTALRLTGACDPDGKMPIEVRSSFIGRKALARASYERMRAWDPERIILAHGRCYERDGGAELDRAFRWLT